MSDYDTSVGVQLYDDFSKIQEALPKIISQLNQLKNTLSSISNISIKSNGLTNLVKQINKLDTIKNIDSQLANLNRTLGNINFTNIKNLREELVKMKKEYNDFISMMNRQTGNKIKKTNTAINVKTSNYQSTGLNDLNGTRNQNITSYIRQMNDGLKSIDNTAKKTKKSINEMFTLGRAYWFINYTKQLFRGLGNIIQNALDFTEVENYFGRSMDNMYNKAMIFQNKLSEMYGMSMSTMMNAQATYKNMIGSLGGLSDDMAYRLSETVTKMTLDFSSLYNVDFEKTVQKMQSALSKQVRPIRSVSGFDITQSVLGATASNIGITRTISQMNELEKRLLVILTLMQQMRNSGAMNDFARTIEQPSNQLRILKEQLIEVGRWIGSVFYGVIGSVLPYINGFVMMIKELVKTFALFVGYELPNSSGETGTILDGYGDSMDDLNTGIGAASGGLDKAKKKAKELKGSLAGFDKLNIISSPKEDNDTGGNGSGSGGGMTVDPKILDALNKYKYLFDDVHMKATKIRDELLKWADIAMQAFNDNIFRPIQNSWIKYGPSTIENFQNAFNDMGIIAGGIFDVVIKKWKPFFSSATDLFFSLYDTGSLVTSSITSFFKNVWINGGDAFLEGIFDLITAFIKLATAINDKFVKPTIKLLNNTFGKAFSTVLGNILKLIGKFMTELSKFVTWISKNDKALLGLVTTLTSLYAVIKIGKFTQLWNSFSTGTSVVSKITTLFVENTKIGSKLFDSYVNGGTKFSNLKNAWNSGMNVISNFLTKMSNMVNKTEVATVSTNTLTTSTTSMTIAQKLCATATGILQNALNFLAAHPLVTVGLAVGTVIIALSSLGNTSKDTTKSIEDCSEEIQEQAKEMKNYSSAVDSAMKSAEDSIANTEAQIRVFRDYSNQLKSLETKNGVVQNMEKAKFLVKEINEIIPGTVKLTKEGKIEWLKNEKAIEKNIVQMRNLAKTQAYQDAYVEAIKNQILQEMKLNDVKKEREGLEKQVLKEFENWKSTYGKHNSTLEDYLSLKTDLNEQYKEQLSLEKDAQKEFDKTGDNIAYLETELDKLNNTTQKTTDETKKMSGEQKKLTNETKKLSAETQKAYNNINDNAKKNIGNVLTSLSSYQKEIEKTSKKQDSESKKQVQSLQQERQLKIVEYGKMAHDYELSAEQIIELAESKGVALTEEEQGTIKSIVQAYKDGGQKGGNEFVDNLSTKIRENSWKTQDSSKKNVEDANKVISGIPLFIKTTVESAVKKAQEARAIAQKNVGNINIKAIVTGAREAGKKAGEEFKNGFKTSQILAEGAGFLSHIGSAAIKFFADGGFPDVGQMFIAREKGPELVGTMGSRSVVANNDQIVTGIYKGVRQAMNDSQQQRGGDIYIKHQTILDGKVIDERIEKVNQESILKTGKPKFLE